MPRIVLDPGHGGRDSGARGKRLRLWEKDVNLKVCLMLRDALRRAGIEVLMTREKDTERVPGVVEAVDLKARAMLANTHRADLFVSWHYDVCTDLHVKGVAVWIHQSEKGGWVYHKADLLAHQIAASSGQKNRGVYLGDHAELRHAHMDALLVQGGFLTNLEEEAQLTQDEFLQKQAEGAAMAICQMFGLPYVAPDDEVAVEKPKSARSMVTDVLVAVDGNVVVRVNGRELGQHARMIDGQTYLPVRELAELLGCAVAWDGDSHTVMLTRGE